MNVLSRRWLVAAAALVPAVATSTLTVNATVLWKGAPLALTKKANFTVLKRPAEPTRTS